jgi:23S rRNA (adenine2030-N6)-methyltransferase
VWYPLIRHSGPERLVAALAKLTLPRAFRVELEIAPDSQRMRGSGLVIANLPYGADAELVELLPWLDRRLSRDPRSAHVARWL